MVGRKLSMVYIYTVTDHALDFNCLRNTLIKYFLSIICSSCFATVSETSDGVAAGGATSRGGEGGDGTRAGDDLDKRP